MNTFEDLKNGIVGICFENDLIRLRLILKSVFPNSDAPINGNHKYYFVVKSFPGVFGASDEQPQHVTKWVSENEIIIPLENKTPVPNPTQTPWALNYEGGKEIKETHKNRGWNRAIATFNANIDAIRCIECVNAMSGIKNPEKWINSVKDVFNIFDEYVKNHPESKVGESKSQFILYRAKKYDDVLEVLKSIKEMVDNGNQITEKSIIFQSLLAVVK